MSNGLYFKTIELIFILFCNLFLKTSSINIVNTVKPVYAVTFINQSPNSPVLKGHLSIILSIRLHINWTIRGYKSYKDNLSLSQKWPLNTGLTVYTSWCTMCFSYYLHKIWSKSWKANSFLDVLEGLAKIRLLLLIPEGDDL